MADYYCISCGGDLIPVETAYGPQHRCTHCMYISKPLKIRDWRGECPICYESYDSIINWSICTTCAHYTCLQCRDNNTKCPFCTQDIRYIVRKDRLLRADLVKYYSQLNLHIRINFNEFHEYIRWLTIKLERDDLIPPSKIERIWRTHILDMENYSTFCMAQFKSIIYHRPNYINITPLAETHTHYIKKYGPIDISDHELWDMPNVFGQPAIGTISYCDGKTVPLIKNMTIMELRWAIAEAEQIHIDRITAHIDEVALDDAAIVAKIGTFSLSIGRSD